MHGLLALATATGGCRVATLDAVNGKSSAVLVDPGGRSFRMTSSAAELVEAARSGEPAEAVAARFGTSSEELDRAANELAARIAGALRSADTKLHGFLAHRTLVSGERATRWASHGTWLFRRAVLPAAAVLALAVVVLARVADRGAQLPTYALWSGFAIAIAVMFVHELGHAAACRSAGAPVGAIGCALYIVYPAFYCDVTHTWSLPRRARILVDLGGVYFQLIGTAIVAILWWLTGSTVLQAAIRVSVATIAVNLLPVGRFDGYWLMSDLLGIVGLRGEQRRLVAAAWARLRGRPAAPLPWPWWTTGVIAGYALATAWFVVSILTRFLPHVLVELWRLPARVVELGGADTVSAAAASIGAIVSSIIVAVIAALLVQSTLRSVIALVRRRGVPVSGTPVQRPER